MDNPTSGVEVRLFCLTCHFWVWWKSHCSSPIAAKSFGNAKTLLFFPAFAGSFPCFSYKEVSDWQKISLSTHLFYSIFFTINTVICCHLVPNTLETQSRPSLTFSQSQHSKSLLNVYCAYMCTHTYTHTHTHTHTHPRTQARTHNPFDYKLLILNQNSPCC